MESRSSGLVVAIVCFIFAVGLLLALGNVQPAIRKWLILCCLLNVLAGSMMIYERWTYAFRLAPYGWDDDRY